MTTLEDLIDEAINQGLKHCCIFDGDGEVLAADKDFNLESSTIAELLIAFKEYPEKNPGRIKIADEKHFTAVYEPTFIYTTSKCVKGCINLFDGRVLLTTFEPATLTGNKISADFANYLSNRFKCAYGKSARK